MYALCTVYCYSVCTAHYMLSTVYLLLPLLPAIPQILSPELPLLRNCFQRLPRILSEPVFLIPSLPDLKSVTDSKLGIRNDILDALDILDIQRNLH